MHLEITTNLIYRRSTKLYNFKDKHDLTYGYKPRLELNFKSRKLSEGGLVPSTIKSKYTLRCNHSNSHRSGFAT